MEDKTTYCAGSRPKDSASQDHDQLIVTYDDRDGDIPTLVVMRYDGVYHYCINLVQGEEARKIHNRLITWEKQNNQTK